MNMRRGLGTYRPVQPLPSQTEGSTPAMREFIREMTLLNLSPVTIESRVELVERLRTYLTPTPLLEATAEDLRRFQAQFANRAPATVDVYTRHVKAFFRWAHERGHVQVDPAAGLSTPRLSKRMPHPMSIDDVRVIFMHSAGLMRVVFTLACFAGLRRGEICRLQRSDLDLTSDVKSALIHGKGGKERVVPLLPPVIDELMTFGLHRSGFIVSEHGFPIDPERLSQMCARHLKSIGLRTTLHEGRHWHATYIVRLTKDPVLAQQMLGHQSLDTTMNYVKADMSGAHERLADFTRLAESLRAGPQLRLVQGG